MHAGLLMLVDGRFPAGGHAYSAGVESAVAVGDVVDTATLERYLHGRLATTGQVDAAFAASACARMLTVDDAQAWGETLDREYSARVPSPYLRSISRRLGRQLLRVSRRIWPGPGLDALAAVDGGPHQAIALGAIVGAAGGSPADAVALSCHHLTTAVTSSAIRLLGLDPIELAVVQERAGRRSDAFQDSAEFWALAPLPQLPASGGSLTEILGERHGTLDARMFVA